MSYEGLSQLHVIPQKTSFHAKYEVENIAEKLCLSAINRRPQLAPLSRTAWSSADRTTFLGRTAGGLLQEATADLDPQGSRQGLISSRCMVQ